jgi:hypothetical protein
VGVYRFYRSRVLPRAIVTRAAASLPRELDAQDWQHTLDRAAEETNADVRHEVDQHGYCLIESECSFVQLAHELEHAAGAEDPPGTPGTAPQPQSLSPDEYHFYVHRTLKAWRMAFRSRDQVVALTRLEDWRFSRSRSAADTAPSVRDEIAARGYSLFKIGGDLTSLVAGEPQLQKGTVLDN